MDTHIMRFSTEFSTLAHIHQTRQSYFVGRQNSLDYWGEYLPILDQSESFPLTKFQQTCEKLDSGAFNAP